MPVRAARWRGKIPFVRLLACLIAGIGLQWQFDIQLTCLVSALLVSFLFFVSYSMLPLTTKYQFAWLGGIVVSLFIVFCGCVLVRINDVRHDQLWIGKQYRADDMVIVTLEEPLVNKTNSYKAVASVHAMLRGNDVIYSKGKLILYFKKDSFNARLRYGTRIIFQKPIQEVRNGGNPGSFDFRRYCLFQGITHQVYLIENDYKVISTAKKKWLSEFIFHCNDWVVGVVRKFIHGEKEQGLAEALLIGYKGDLDKELVQSYSNTGVVHVIAISGLHLGLIYWLLLLLTTPLQRKKQTRWLRFMIIIVALWWFSIMAGAQPSVLRSAVMFSFIALGEVIERKGSVLNTLALSAFVLLSYNPFWLWDIGFQLSYAAVLSILTFFKPVYNWFYFENKLLDIAWKLNAVTISAQLLTVPVSIYHFHQLPVLFLFTNIVAVPLSSVILFAEILLCVLFFVGPVAGILGQFTCWMIWCMNTYIERWSRIAFSSWTDLSINGMQALLLTAFILCICFWLMENKKSLLWISLACILSFTIFRTVSFVQSGHIKKLIVYNVPKHNAIDLVTGRTAIFIGDPVLLQNASLQNFQLRPARIGNRTSEIRAKALKNFDFHGRHVWIIDSSLNFYSGYKKQVVDLLILSKNPRFNIKDFMKSFLVKQIVIDSSVPAWKSGVWKKECDSFHIPCYVVSDHGAFVMNL